MKKKYLALMTLAIGLLFGHYEASASYYADVESGDTIQFGGVEWLVLDPEDGRVIWDEPDINGDPFWKTRTFDDGSSNVWETSDVRADLNNNLVNDLDFSDGSNSDVITNIDLITEDEYIEYSTYYNGDILDFNDWDYHWWTKNPTSDSTFRVQRVSGDGFINYNSASSSIGTRPALNLEPRIFKPVPEVSKLTADQTDTTVTLQWENSDVSEVDRVNIYKDDNLSASLKNGEDIYIFNELDYSTEYSFKVTTVNNDGEESVGKTINVKTDYIYLEDITVHGVYDYYNRIFLNWDNPTQEGFEKVLVYENGEFIDEVEAPYSSYLFEHLKPDTDYTFLLTSLYDPYGETEGVEVNARTSPVPEVEELTIASNSYHEVSLIWTLPEMQGYDFAALYYEGEKVAQTDGYKFYIEGFEPGKTHEFEVKTVTEDGYESNGVPISVDTPEAPEKEDVSNVEVSTTYDRVDLSWSIPEYNPNFEFVRIYRKDMEDSDENVVSTFLFGSTASANDDDYDPLFETNGTYFNDLSVESDSDYEYKLTTENTEGEESDGVFVQASTEEEPLPEMGGVNDEKDENGDYVYSWSRPTEGEVQVLVGRDEYATVPASQGEITIPADDMQYTLMGDPDVELVPISESGLVGVPSDPNLNLGGTGLPFSPNEVLKTAMQFLLIIGPFVLLTLAVYFTPKLIRLIKQSANQNQNRRRGRV
ncbi:fibronectin type III domain-containing protein [Desertibacillus haloalkaliphilus]|uniref:fibronectin type III domain-containing protein n=1 Tax=Desertibacillus haloalkaliphilus TaxID=1328930 RepID=UPI001C273E05|nr:fibronectin type III domain-containing protein [Desertibacillus haloalkaliphilus]MBU8905575.1 fibronectin type III domain-containing protein [Desertibacillus haloalkaliphilus]